MSNINQYPKNGYWIVASSSQTELGGYNVAADGDLSLVQFRIFNKAIVPYSYQMRMILSSREGGPILAATDWFEFSNATTGQAGTDWLGDVAFNFNSYHLTSGEVYYLRLETSGYTRLSRPLQNNTYLAVWCDWMQSVSISNTAGARVALGVMR